MLSNFCHNFSTKEQAPFNFMAAVTICSDLEQKKERKKDCVSIVSPSVCHEMMALDAMILFFEC